MAYANFVIYFGRNNLDFDIDTTTAAYASAITITYLTIVLSQLVNIYIRRSSGPTFGKYLFTNKKLHLAMLLSVICVAAIIYLPPLQFIFGSGSLSPIDWAWAAAGALIFFIVREAFKLVKLAKNKNPLNQANS